MPPLTTSRLLIRPLCPTDEANFHLYRSNPDVTRYQSFEPMTRADAAAFIGQQQHRQFGTPGEWVQYGIERQDTGQLIGDCALHLHEHDPRIGEIGITLSHLAQGQGYARETMLALLQFLFGEKQLHRVVETVDAENTASIKLLQTVGFRQEGHFVENIFFKGKWGSEFQYALLRREWEAQQ
ncbi:MAG: GNAT family N-acetyltransferase [Janthinobacterium lividum]